MTDLVNHKFEFFTRIQCLSEDELLTDYDKGVYSYNLSDYKTALDYFENNLENVESLYYAGKTCYSLSLHYKDSYELYISKMYNYYMRALQRGNYKVYVQLGNQCCDIKDYNKAYMYYDTALKHKEYSAYYCLSKHYQTIKDFNNYKLSLKNGARYKDKKCLYYLLNDLYKSNKYDEMIEYSNIGIEINDGLSYYCLGYYHMYININYEKSIDYLVKSIENGCNKAYKHLCFYYENINHDSDKFMYYLIKGSESNRSICMIELLRHYMSIKDYDNLLKQEEHCFSFLTYCKKSKIPCMIMMDYYTNVDKNTFKFYYYLHMFLESIDYDSIDYKLPLIDLSNNIPKYDELMLNIDKIIEMDNKHTTIPFYNISIRYKLFEIFDYEMEDEDDINSKYISINEDIIDFDILYKHHFIDKIKTCPLC
jgi:hypothetical protein